MIIIIIIATTNIYIVYVHIVSEKVEKIKTRLEIVRKSLDFFDKKNHVSLIKSGILQNESKKINFIPNRLICYQHRAFFNHPTFYYRSYFVQGLQKLITFKMSLVYWYVPDEQNSLLIM